MSLRYAFSALTLFSADRCGDVCGAAIGLRADRRGDMCGAAIGLRGDFLNLSAIRVRGDFREL